MKEIVEALINYYTTPATSNTRTENQINKITAIVLKKYHKYLTGGKKVN